MLFLNHEYNKDNYITQREATWDFINEKLELKELSKKSNYNFKMKLDELSGFEIKKADDWLSRLTEIFMQLTYDLSEIVLANRLAREDNEKKAYFLFNFRYYFTNLTNGIYTFWNMVAQYFNVLYSGQNNEPNKRKWEEEEEKIDCGFFKADVITKRESLQPMLELYRSELNKEILKLRHLSVHRRKIPIIGLGKDYYTRITENMIEFAAEYELIFPRKSGHNEELVVA